MTSDPTESPEGSNLSPRQRLRVGELNKDSMEQDLWDLDADEDGLEQPKEAVETPSPEISLPPVSTLKTREIGGKKTAKEPDEAPVKAVTTKLKAPVRGDFDDLDLDEPEEKPAKVATPVAKSEPAASPALADVPVPEADEVDDFSPQPIEKTEPTSLRPSLGLSKLERMGMIALLVVLVLGGAWFLVQSLSGLPKESAMNERPDFPIKGEKVTITDIATYWRAPILEGENADTVRRGTELMPVAEIQTEGASAAFRVFFRNAEGEVMGDPQTRSVAAGSTLTVTATAGFDDEGMHAAYRTGLSNAWTLEILEGPSENAPGDSFKRLLKMNISPDRR